MNTENRDEITRRRMMAGTLGFAAATIGVTSFMRPNTQKLEVAELGITVFAKHDGFTGLRSNGVSGAELSFTERGHYVVEVLDGSSGTSGSLQKHEFDVTETPHHKTLPEWESRVPVLIHFTILTEQHRVKTGLAVVGVTE